MYKLSFHNTIKHRLNAYINLTSTYDLETHKKSIKVKRSTTYFLKNWNKT